MQPTPGLLADLASLRPMEWLVRLTQAIAVVSLLATLALTVLQLG